MFSVLSKFESRRLRRPYWLALALVLFFAGQIVGSAHWHNSLLHNTTDQLDADCALCMLSNANGVAVSASSWPPLTIPLSGIICIAFAVSRSRSVVRFFDSRAPPFLPSSNV
jgi:hypothetical protein